MQVHVLCEGQPPEALVRAAQDARSCPNCGGLIELDRLGGLWFATHAHASACRWCSPTEQAEPAAPVVRLATFRTT